MRQMLNKESVICLAAIILCSCSTTQAPVDSRATDSAYRAAPVSGSAYDPEPVSKGFHEVVKGDTLYSISWRYGLDYRDIALWNDISGEYIIYPGQKLGLKASAGIVTRPLKEEPEITAYPLPDPSKPVNSNQLIVEEIKPSPVTKPQVTGPVNTEQVKSGPVRSVPALNQGKFSWQWPTKGKLIRSNSPVAQKGLDITGTEGQPVTAAATGVVVYSGSGLLGYGKLIIIKHNETYLSAYAHNQMIQVKEGDAVSAGQTIGTMGQGNKGQPLLHFEIRKDGKPVDPLQYLPAT